MEVKKRKVKKEKINGEEDTSSERAVYRRGKKLENKSDETSILQG